jgi:hypothetical protein
MKYKGSQINGKTLLTSMATVLWAFLRLIEESKSSGDKVL